MFSPIVVPLDGSALAERALLPARALARHNQAELRLLRVAVPRHLFVPADAGFGVLSPDLSLIEAREEADQYLDAVRAACASGELAARVDVREGDVAAGIVDAAHEAGAGLIVLSSHGYSGMKRWLLGSVAEKVLNAAPCPVWVVRAAAPTRHVLVTLDGSPLAEEVLPSAIQAALALEAQVTLLRVVPAIKVPELQALDDCERGLGRRWVEETHEEAASYLTLVADRFGYADLDVRTAVRSGPAADTILEFAERHAVDLVAMTTHGRTGLRRWIYGSVTHKVLDCLPVSMLIAR